MGPRLQTLILGASLLLPGGGLSLRVMPPPLLGELTCRMHLYIFCICKYMYIYIYTSVYLVI